MALDRLRVLTNVILLINATETTKNACICYKIIHDKYAQIPSQGQISQLKFTENSDINRKTVQDEVTVKGLYGVTAFILTMIITGTKNIDSPQAHTQ